MEHELSTENRLLEDPEAARDRLISEAASLFGRSDPEAGIAILRKLQSLPIDETALQLTDRFFRPWIVGERQVIATSDPERSPDPGEVVVIYGNYPHFHRNLIISNPIKRHVSLFWNLQHDRVEYDPGWERVDRIYVLNADHRVDRGIPSFGSSAAPVRLSIASPEYPRVFRRTRVGLRSLQGRLAACKAT